ncbi:hypothetical protein CAOG_04854 [Capsaspora owczarzaki ATCC 30864]|uniref:Uncharacterized protein n=1 Tax=Capsaspora owczarzaki (strain ATCC 30864) TaxID=595528 RepID=A0A0D2UGH9_CAPO3|nr:hypothetical protein CAOG_04854 [Capsaspora owczarzaki ATCC 30864]KJE94171.1 hypothetical protein CAOG_004854 [Capsaspora owczarzaki ATCC 30864]|eukprot:XP_004347605.1 hypothetical protein CAOG_04854 [Capsaspora owczarzaki ATCC 30864]
MAYNNTLDDFGSPLQPAESYYQKRASSGIYGWKKFLIWLLVISITVIAIVNIALTAWIMRELNFSSGGMDGTDFSDAGLLVDNALWVGGTINGNALKTYSGASLDIESAVDIDTTCGRDFVATTGRDARFAMSSNTGVFGVSFPASTPLAIGANSVTVTVPLTLTRPFITTGIVSTTTLRASAVGTIDVAAGAALSLTTPTTLNQLASTFSHQPISTNQVVFYTGSTIPKVLSQCSCTTTVAGSTRLMTYWVDAAAATGCSSIPANDLATLCP